MFTKTDLKDGMIVEFRNGNRYLLCNEILRSINGFNPLMVYTDDLLEKNGFKHLDIVKVYKDTKKYSLENMFRDEFLHLIWERKTRLEDLTKEELIKIIKKERNE